VRSGRFDHLVIESTGISEPLLVAETFMADAETLAAGANHHGSSGGGSSSSSRSRNNSCSSSILESLVGVAQLDTMVTVVDAVNCLRAMGRARRTR